MERLTVKKDSKFLIDRIKYLPKNQDSLFEMLNKLGELEDLEEQGLLIRLPCKPNEEVWVGHNKFSLQKTMYVSASGIIEDMEDGWVIGRTKAEAEKALAEMG